MEEAFWWMKMMMSSVGSRATGADYGLREWLLLWTSDGRPQSETQWRREISTDDESRPLSVVIREAAWVGIRIKRVQ